MQRTQDRASHFATMRLLAQQDRNTLPCGDGRSAQSGLHREVCNVPLTSIRDVAECLKYANTGHSPTAWLVSDQPGADVGRGYALTANRRRCRDNPNKQSLGIADRGIDRAKPLYLTLCRGPRCRDDGFAGTQKCWVRRSQAWSQTLSRSSSKISVGSASAVPQARSSISRSSWSGPQPA
jgi:hypothetical protein